MSITGLPGVESTSKFTQIIGVAPAAAQNATRKKRRSIFSVLFGRKKARRKAVKKKSKRVRSRRKKKSRKARKRPTSKRRLAKPRRSKKSKTRRAKRKLIPAPIVVEKLETAKNVLVVGDFFSGALASGLDKAFKELVDVKVVDKSNGNSGFVRNDIIDWPATLAATIAENKPAYIVAMLGSNDRQLMRENGAKLKKRTPEWDEAYKKRVEALGEVLKASRVPYIWVGLPPVRFKSMNKDFLFFNELYGKAAQSRNGRFIDIWDGFSDAEGNYSRSGPDVNGQIVLLRPKDGINLTKAGRQRLAYYVQGQIEKAISSGGAYVNSSLAFDIEDNLPKTSTYNPKRTGKTVVISLDDPASDGAQILAGAKSELKNGDGKLQGFTVPGINESAPTVRRVGRVDDYTWPRQSPSQTGTPALAIAN
ncbi:MAG: DUF459 domain-containing protein [Rhizobiaceae bacterium]